MKERPDKRAGQDRGAASKRRPLSATTVLLTFIAVLVIAGYAVTKRYSDTAKHPNPQPAGPVTFNKHVAPILFANCTPCHRPGEAAPFSLITYKDAHSRAKLIAEVTGAGVMPPWLAERGYGDFSNERRLSDGEKSVIQQWVAGGALEGESPAPQVPTWPTGWKEGTPDLVVAMARPYQLGPEGPDVYRNFTIPIPLDRNRLVRAVEFSAGNPQIVHHAFIRVDDEGQARKLEGSDGEPGFNNMISTARMPGGQFLTWNPGSRPVVAPLGLAWPLRKNSDLVVEMHLNRTGKPETLQSSVGIYFTDEQPTNTCYVVKLGSYALDFPAGTTNEIVRDSFVLPVDVDVLAVYPHAHFLAREMQGYAMRPDGSKEWLIWIKQWDFNWQGDYRYKKPVYLPKGSTVHLQFAYDNSTNNPANPHNPPHRVVYGQRSIDEMCELGLQILTRRTNDVTLLAEASGRHRENLMQEALRQRVAANPNDVESLLQLSMRLWMVNRRPEAWDYLERANKLRPDFAGVHYNRGVFLRFSGQPAEARQSFETVLRLDPRFPKAHQQLAFALAALGMLADAERAFEKALELNPADTESQDGLAELRQVIKSREHSN